MFYLISFHAILFCYAQTDDDYTHFCPIQIRGRNKQVCWFHTSPQCKSTESQPEETRVTSRHQVCWTPVVSIDEWNDSENKWTQVSEVIFWQLMYLIKIDTYMIVYCLLWVNWLLDPILKGHCNLGEYIQTQNSNIYKNCEVITFHIKCNLINWCHLVAGMHCG